jgi:diguanylate cyclase (GGDEF)-like protein/PAS domain S-box-containing protein
MAGENKDDKIDFQFLTENSADIICRVDLDHKMTYASPSLYRLLGWSPEEVIGRGPEALVLPEDLPILLEGANRHRAEGIDPPPLTVRMMKKDGSHLWVETNARVALDPATGKPLDLVLVMRDITDRKRLEDQLRALAMTDGLTGIANRRAFDQELDREWKRTLREGSQISLLLLDLDHFKQFNDFHGHQVGDDCLRAICAAVTEAVRVTDIPARYGGEEIAVILPGTDMAGAVAVAEKVRCAIEALHVPHESDPDGRGWMTASIGVATALARTGGTMRMPESLLQAADTALYKAKAGGRNRAVTTLLMAPDES